MDAISSTGSERDALAFSKDNHNHHNTVRPCCPVNKTKGNYFVEETHSTIHLIIHEKYFDILCLVVITLERYGVSNLNGINGSHYRLFVRGIHPHKGPIISNVFPCDDVIMCIRATFTHILQLLHYSNGTIAVDITVCNNDEHLQDGVLSLNVTTQCQECRNKLFRSSMLAWHDERDLIEITICYFTPNLDKFAENLWIQYDQLKPRFGPVQSFDENFIPNMASSSDKIIRSSI